VYAIKLFNNIIRLFLDTVNSHYLIFDLNIHKYNHKGNKNHKESLTNGVKGITQVEELTVLFNITFWQKILV
jgi:hypothetical protein